MYQKLIKQMLKGKDFDPRHIEGYLRLKFGTLDHLDRKTFKWEVGLAIKAILMEGKPMAESNAQSYGL